MKKLTVDIAEIAELMDTSFDETECYLDLQTGKTEAIPAEMCGMDEEEDELSSLPDWQKDLLAVVKEIEAETGRYVPIPEPDSREAYDDMVRFADTVTDPDLRKQFHTALDGRGAFRCFRNVLDDHDSERQRWFVFKDKAMAERVREWLAEIGIEPVEAPGDQQED